MKRYQINHEAPGQAQSRLLRFRRDAAALQVEHAIYDAAEAQGMRDTISAHNAMQVASRAYEPDCYHLSIKLGSHTVTFFGTS